MIIIVRMKSGSELRECFCDTERTAIDIHDGRKLYEILNRAENPSQEQEEYEY